MTGLRNDERGGPLLGEGDETFEADMCHRGVGWQMSWHYGELIGESEDQCVCARMRDGASFSQLAEAVGRVGGGWDWVEKVTPKKPWRWCNPWGSCDFLGVVG